MPGLEAKARKHLLLHQFLGGLPERVSRQLRAMGELDTAITRARLIMTIHDPGRSATVTEKPSEVAALKEQVALLTEQVAALLTSSTPTRRTPNDQQHYQQLRRRFHCN